MAVHKWKHLQVLCALLIHPLVIYFPLGSMFQFSESLSSFSTCLARHNLEPAIWGFHTSFALFSCFYHSISLKRFRSNSWWSFYVVQRGLGQTSSTKGTLCHDHFFATVGIFSGIFLVNCRLMNWAAYVFNSNGLVQLTSQDALSLLDQVGVGWVNVHFSVYRFVLPQTC